MEEPFVDIRDFRQRKSQADDTFAIRWHGDPDDRPMREWLVDLMITMSGTALLSGQWGTYKTFVAFDLAGAVMTKTPFAGYEVQRQGGVLFVAVEGQDEVRIRLTAAVEQRCAQPNHDALPVDPERMPFAWIEACPKLSGPDALPALQKIVKAAAEAMLDRFELPLVLVLIDTLSPAAEFRDANDTAENQRVMTVLKTVAREFNLMVAAVDHFGKDVTTGTRNSSVKEADVDSVLALLGEKDLAGNVTNPRLAIRKVRGAATGAEIGFGKRVVNVGMQTTLVIDWAAKRAAERTEPGGKPSRWPKSLIIFKQALDVTLLDHGAVVQPFGVSGPKVRAVDRERVREEFFKIHPADKETAKKQAFLTAAKTAIERQVMVSRDVGASTLFWPTAEEPVQSQ